MPDGGSVELEVSLDHVVDTSGWISSDTHVHSAPSPDSRSRPRTRLLDAAAAGLEVIVNTNHEAIIDLEPWREATEAATGSTMITGQEVTASMPEHTTMYPVEPDGTERGGIRSGTGSRSARSSSWKPIAEPRSADSTTRRDT